MNFSIFLSTCTTCTVVQASSADMQQKSWWLTIRTKSCHSLLWGTRPQCLTNDTDLLGPRPLLVRYLTPPANLSAVKASYVRVLKPTTTINVEKKTKRALCLSALPALHHRTERFGDTPHNTADRPHQNSQARNRCWFTIRRQGCAPPRCFVIFWGRREQQLCRRTCLLSFFRARSRRTLSSLPDERSPRASGAWAASGLHRVSFWLEGTRLWLCGKESALCAPRRSDSGDVISVACA